MKVVSKSGATLEPAIAFRILRAYMEEKYGREEAGRRIFVTTDKSKGILKELADREGYQTFVVPHDIGGRYSLLTPVGLLPMAVAGIDIDRILEGATTAAEDFDVPELATNGCYQYAVLRNLLCSKGKEVEVLVSYEPQLMYLGAWFKQLFAESEGKKGKGIFPTALNFTTDLHSMGQYLQEGKRNLFETVLKVQTPTQDMPITALGGDDRDGLNELVGQRIGFVNHMALEGTVSAHVAGGVPNLIIHIPEITPYHFGYLVYFFMKACGISGYLLGVNPFDQPGVEAYKRNMLALLAKERAWLEVAAEKE